MGDTPPQVPPSADLAEGVPQWGGTLPWVPPQSDLAGGTPTGGGYPTE